MRSARYIMQKRCADSCALRQQTTIHISTPTFPSRRFVISNDRKTPSYRYAYTSRRYRRQLFIRDVHFALRSSPLVQQRWLVSFSFLFSSSATEREYAYVSMGNVTVLRYIAFFFRPFYGTEISERVT